MSRSPVFKGYREVIVFLKNADQVYFDPNDPEAVVTAMNKLIGHKVDRLTVLLKPCPIYGSWKKAVAEDRVLTSFAEFEENHLQTPELTFITD